MPDLNEEEIQELLDKLAGRIAGTDEQILEEEASRITQPLEELCTTIEENQFLITQIKDNLNDFFQNSENKRILRPEEFAANLPDHSGESFFTNMYSAFRGVIINAIDHYSRLPINVKLLVTEPMQAAEGKKPPAGTVAKAILQAKKLTAITATLFAELKANLPSFIEYAQKYVEIHNKYLKDRFIEHEEEPADKHIRIIRDLGEQKTEYVKIKLVEDNPVLTDVLLDFTEELPQYRERMIKESKKHAKKVREVSAFAIANSARRLLKISDPKLYGYITNSKQYFQHITDVVKDFYYLLQLLERPNEAIRTNPSVRMVYTDPKIREAVDQPFEPSIQRNLNRTQNTDFEDIVQSEDDLLPENRREKDYFKLRDKLLEHTKIEPNSYKETRIIDN